MSDNNFDEFTDIKLCDFGISGQLIGEFMIYISK